MAYAKSAAEAGHLVARRSTLREYSRTSVLYDLDTWILQARDISF